MNQPTEINPLQWKKACSIGQIKTGQKACVQFGSLQIALFHAEEELWYALQNRCTHTKQNVISRGILGDKEGELKVACALHKNQFSLTTGKCLNADLQALQTYPVKIEGDEVFIGLPA